ncbi:hypothetical protein HG536_0A06260 [Torulaspora globosa]|uniref:DDHD domain-containing protein n=1 Tax=Torulaspora globosa TaxID=48254 RepID=A0A7G3ZBC5_9SACH|nr:uncharacterized protein HG536_0A06260 [Torulaspora globosa]QLL30811.1 hypothetical protein HG536_0A06260 [Torulaspora globosa]
MLRRPLTCLIRSQRSFGSTIVIRTAKRCPVLWYYASDVPLTKPHDPSYKPGKPASKFVKFSVSDCERLERAFQGWKESQRKLEDVVSVPVNEDFLFQVDVPKMELKSTYWRGPTYEVRRGVWFDSSNVPLPSEVTAELELYYLKLNFKSDDENAQDVFKLSHRYGEYKLVVFTDQKTAYLLPHLDGGDLQLKLLRANIGALQGEKITRAGDDGSPPMDVAAAAKKKIENGIQSKAAQLGNISDLISWELPGVFGMTKDKDTEKGTDDGSNVLKREIETDYDSQATTSRRKVDHLVFCVHGIGQTLGKKYEYVNFTHTVNVLRSNLKKVYSESKQLKNLNKERGADDWKNNCGIQVLPITWRHTIGFQTDATKPNDEYPELPTLADITLNGILGLRRLLGDIALDILLYDEPFYRERILSEVHRHLNDVYRLYRERNPEFNGDVHLIGHSLGSLILFDILCEQDKYRLDFSVKNYYCIGSPIGVFKLIQRTKIQAACEEERKSSANVQKPKCENLYNLFHICDPISYRIEPLVDLSMAQYQPAIISHWSTGEGIASRVMEIGGSILKDIPGAAIKGGNTKKDKSMLPLDVAQRLMNLNHTGRLDYSLTPGFLEVDIISAAKAHVSYFEDLDVAGFILKEMLSKHNRRHHVIVTKENLPSID